MVKVIGVRFRTAGKIYFFNPLQFEVKRGDHVIVETARGIEFGTAVSDIREVDESAVVQPLKPILRIANQRDCDQEAGNKIKEKEAFKICQEKIRKHNLEMKLIDAEYTFDNNKVLFYFTADGRIDFRELVKDLAGVFKTRIELRQIGVRDETKIMGGLGICGRPLCCHTYLADFNAVSIKMAKEQNLSLNPTKISGVCGRLMCCLKNEEETYEELNRRLPGIGDRVLTADGQRGEVQSVNVLRQLVKVLIESGDNKELKEFEVDQLRFQKRHGKKDRQNLSEEELKELELLEQEDARAAELAAEENARRDSERSSGKGGQGRDKGARQNRPGKDRGDRQEQGDAQERQGRQNKGGRDRGDRQEQGEASERQGRSGRDRGDRQEQGGAQERQGRQNKGGRDRGDRQEQGGAQERQGRQNKGGKDRGDRQEQGSAQERQNRQNKGGKDREDRGGQKNRGDRQGRGEGQESNHSDRNKQEHFNRNKNRFRDHGKQDRGQNNQETADGGKD